MSDGENAAMLELADRFFAAIERGDVDGVRAMYSADAVVWHNFDGVEQTVEQNLATLGWIAKNFTEFRYDERRCLATDGGFVEQHVTRGRTPKGTEFSFPACIVATVTDGHVSRIDEYLDTAQMAVLRD